MMQFFLLRISIRNLDLAPVRNFESNLETERRVDTEGISKSENLSLKRKSIVNPII